MESYLVKRALELSRRYETICNLHAKLMGLVETYGQPDEDGQAPTAKGTPNVPINEGWEATVYKPEQNDESQEKVYNPVLIRLKPSISEGTDDFTLPYLFEEAGIWLAVGEEEVIDDDTLEKLTDEEIEGLYSDVTTIIEPYLVSQANQTTQES